MRIFFALTTTAVLVSFVASGNSQIQIQRVKQPGVGVGTLYRSAPRAFHDSGKSFWNAR
jgi:hypothetical protein